MFSENHQENKIQTDILPGEEMKFWDLCFVVFFLTVMAVAVEAPYVWQYISILFWVMSTSTIFSTTGMSLYGLRSQFISVLFADSPIMSITTLQQNTEREGFFIVLFLSLNQRCWCRTLIFYTKLSVPFSLMIEYIVLIKRRRD